MKLPAVEASLEKIKRKQQSHLATDDEENISAGEETEQDVTPRKRTYVKRKTKKEIEQEKADAKATAELKEQLAAKGKALENYEKLIQTQKDIVRCRETQVNIERLKLSKDAAGLATTTLPNVYMTKKDQLELNDLQEKILNVVFDPVEENIKKRIRRLKSILNVLKTELPKKGIQIPAIDEKKGKKGKRQMQNKEATVTTSQNEGYWEVHVDEPTAEEEQSGDETGQAMKVAVEVHNSNGNPVLKINLNKVTDDTKNDTQVTHGEKEKTNTMTQKGDELEDYLLSVNDRSDTQNEDMDFATGNESDHEKETGLKGKVNQIIQILDDEEETGKEANDTEKDDPSGLDGSSEEKKNNVADTEKEDPSGCDGSSENKKNNGPDTKKEDPSGCDGSSENKKNNVADTEKEDPSGCDGSSENKKNNGADTKKEDSSGCDGSSEDPKNIGVNRDNIENNGTDLIKEAESGTDTKKDDHTALNGSSEEEETKGTDTEKEDTRILKTKYANGEKTENNGTEVIEQAESETDPKKDDTSDLNALNEGEENQEVDNTTEINKKESAKNSETLKKSELDAATALVNMSSEGDGEAKKNKKVSFNLQEDERVDDSQSDSFMLSPSSSLCPEGFVSQNTGLFDADTDDCDEFSDFTLDTDASVSPLPKDFPRAPAGVGGAMRMCPTLVKQKLRNLQAEEGHIYSEFGSDEEKNLTKKRWTVTAMLFISMGMMMVMIRKMEKKKVLTFQAHPQSQMLLLMDTTK